MEIRAGLVVSVSVCPGGGRLTGGCQQCGVQSWSLLYNITGLKNSWRDKYRGVNEVLRNLLRKNAVDELEPSQ